MNRVDGQSKYNYRIGTYTTTKFMLLQSKSASRLWIDSNYNKQDLVTTSRKSVPTVNYILPTMDYTCWQKKRDCTVEQRRPGMGRSKYSHKNRAYTWKEALLCLSTRACRLQSNWVAQEPRTKMDGQSYYSHKIGAYKTIEKKDTSSGMHPFLNDT
jgi:hypothetical protein